MASEEIPLVWPWLWCLEEVLVPGGVLGRLTDSFNTLTCCFKLWTSDETFSMSGPNFVTDLLGGKGGYKIMQPMV